MATVAHVLILLCVARLSTAIAIRESLVPAKGESHPALHPLTPVEMESQERSTVSGDLGMQGTHEQKPETINVSSAPVLGSHDESHHDHQENKEVKAEQPVAADPPAAGTKELEQVKSESAADSAMIDMIVVSPTVRRFDRDRNPAPEQYLVPMVEKMWKDLDTEEKKHVKIYVLNSDNEPDLHLEAESLRLHPGVSVYTKNWQKQAVTDSVAQFSSLEDGREVNPDWVSWVASENADAAFLFEKAKTKAPYILFLEDDVYPTTRALRKLSDHVKELERTHPQEWLFLDLYTPNLDWAPGMLDVKDGEKYPFQCCTQAMLFKSKNVDGIIQYWNDHPREPIDDNLRNFMRDVRPDLSVFAVRPNLFQHVGAYSSNADKSFGVVEHESLDFVPLIL